MKKPEEEFKSDLRAIKVLRPLAQASGQKDLVTAYDSLEIACLSGNREAVALIRHQVVEMQKTSLKGSPMLEQIYASLKIGEEHGEKLGNGLARKLRRLFLREMEPDKK